MGDFKAWSDYEDNKVEKKVELPVTTQSEYDIRKEYHENRLRVNGLLNELLKAGNRKEPVEDLLVMAVECIDLMVGDNNLTAVKHIKHCLYENYGFGEDPFFRKKEIPTEERE